MTQDKRELLELAAFAAGYKETKVDERGWFYARVYEGEPAEWELWNSVDNDADCARLEAAAGIDIAWYEYTVSAGGPEMLRCYERYRNHNGNKDSARRLASTRAAAEVARQMK